MQINAGLDYLGLLSVGIANQLVLIAVITVIATSSAVSGVGRGIRRLSELNMLVGLVLLAFVFAVGPTVFLLSAFVENVGRYLWTLPEASFRTLPYAGSEWQASWTMFYWGWWMSWAPFVGMFIARVSRGRTIREFIGGVLFAPVLLTFVWFTIFGETAIHIEMFEGGGMAQAVAESVPQALFVMLDRLPLPVLSSALAVVMVVTFFVTSADSGALVVAILSTAGDPDPPIATRLFWGLLTGAVAAVLLLVGGLNALQTAAITTALPFALVMALMCVSVAMGLRSERPEGAHEAAPAVRSPEAGPAAPAGPSVEGLEQGDWRQHLGLLVGRRGGAAAPSPSGAAAARREITSFIADVVAPAMRELAAELQRYGRTGELDVRRHGATLTVLRDGVEEFSYNVRGRVYHPFVFAFPEMEAKDEPWEPHAEVILRGGLHKSLDPRRCDREQLIRDFLGEYAKWLGW
jgi:choline/glycine/proline betaine transport protein